MIFIKVAIKVAPIVIRMARHAPKIARAAKTVGKLLKRVKKKDVKRVIKYAKKGKKFIEEQMDNGETAWFEEVDEGDDPCSCWANAYWHERLCEQDIGKD